MGGDNLESKSVDVSTKPQNNTFDCQLRESKDVSDLSGMVKHQKKSLVETVMLENTHVTTAEHSLCDTGAETIGVHNETHDQENACTFIDKGLELTNNNNRHQDDGGDNLESKSVDVSTKPQNNTFDCQLRESKDVFDLSMNSTSDLSGMVERQKKSLTVATISNHRLRSRRHKTKRLTLEKKVLLKNAHVAMAEHSLRDTGANTIGVHSETHDQEKACTFIDKGLELTNNNNRHQDDGGDNLESKSVDVSTKPQNNTFDCQLRESKDVFDLSMNSTSDLSGMVERQKKSLTVATISNHRLRSRRHKTKRLTLEKKVLLENTHVAAAEHSLRDTGAETIGGT